MALDGVRIVPAGTTGRSKVDTPDCRLSFFSPEPITGEGLRGFEMLSVTNDILMYQPADELRGHQNGQLRVIARIRTGASGSVHMRALGQSSVNEVDNDPPYANGDLQLDIRGFYEARFDFAEGGDCTMGLFVRNPARSGGSAAPALNVPGTGTEVLGVTLNDGDLLAMIFEWATDEDVTINPRPTISMFVRATVLAAGGGTLYNDHIPPHICAAQDYEDFVGPTGSLTNSCFFAAVNGCTGAFPNVSPVDLNVPVLEVIKFGGNNWDAIKPEFVIGGISELANIILYEPWEPPGSGTPSEIHFEQWEPPASGSPSTIHAETWES